jgi:hypothetical protein
LRKSPIVIVLSLGLLLTAGVGAAFGHGIASQSTQAALRDEDPCGAQGDQQGEHDDPQCDVNTPGAQNENTGENQAGESMNADKEDDQAGNGMNGQQGKNSAGVNAQGQSGDMNDQQGQSGDNEGEHQD